MYFYFLLFAIIGAAFAAPIKVEYVLAPVPLKQSSTDPSHLVAIIPLNTTQIVIKFDKPILAEIEKTSKYQAAFEEIKLTENESSIVKLKVKGNLKEPVVVGIKDRKNGDSVKVMVKEEGVEEVRGGYKE